MPRVGYLQALRRAVAGIGTLRQVLRDAGIEDRALVIVTADHGGIGRAHVAVVPEVLTIPWIALGRGVKKDFVIERPIVIYDTAATILYALGLTIPSGWDGKPVIDAFAWRPLAPVAGWPYGRSPSSRQVR
jgi:arylsulfatase A-like enzyme